MVHGIGGSGDFIRNGTACSCMCSTAASCWVDIPTAILIITCCMADQDTSP